ncbi:paired amphipathic helix protein Sin3-like 4 [Vicia villosa]|uniref:paired amphipathic helix protein Sin3-like 4 n=1 Tax=Vicia villosa TaxID=3911 RepID=UPI00273B66B3|nr:paired amphipathic helix protein Sin3-like 4 [Vicia villosa]
MEQCIKNAIEFLTEIKGRFTQDKYDEFLTVFMDYMAERIEFIDVMDKMKEILKDHRDLILRLNTFMPTGYEIKLPLEDEQSQPKKRVKLEDATRFLNKIKARFEGDDDHIYKSFMKILIMYHNKNKSFTMVCQEATTLLQGYPDLLDEFYDFLPKSISAHYVAARNSLHGDT